MEESYSALELHVDLITSTGRSIGSGAFASVSELEFCGLKCAGKSLHPSLFCHASETEQKAVVSRFNEECVLLSRLRHPNIVQFMGTYRNGHDTDLPVLVTELLHCSLSSYIKDQGEIPLPREIGHSVLVDVATGLCYLHDHRPDPIVHRDLTANNVLLTSDMRAKISDFGVARILSLSPLGGGLTVCPGTLAYMPPEALTPRPVYNSTIDIFSVGVLCLHVFCGKWPLPSEPNQVDKKGSLLAVSEAERRREYLDALKCDENMLTLVHKCLDNAPDNRPGIGNVLKQLQEGLSVCTGQLSALSSKVELLKEHSALHSKVESLGPLNESLKGKLVEQEEAKKKLQSSHSLELVGARAKLKVLSDELLECRNALELKELEHQDTSQSLESRDVMMSLLTDEVMEKVETIAALEQKISAKEYGLQACELNITALEKQLEAKDQELELIREKTAVQLSSMKESSEATKQMLEAKKNEASAIQSQLLASEKKSELQANKFQIMERELAQKQDEQKLLHMKLKVKSSALDRKADVIKCMGNYVDVLQAEKANEAHILHASAKLNWKSHNKFPHQDKMFFMQSVLHNGVLFVGGQVQSGNDTSFAVYKYCSIDPLHNMGWSVLPKCPVKACGLGKFSQDLVLIGGSRMGKVTNEVYAFEENYQQWVSSLPDMLISRCAPCVVSFPGGLAVCGGLDSNNKPLSLVEVMQTDTCKWRTTAPLPFKCMLMQSVVVGNECYLAGGWFNDHVSKSTRFVVSASLSELLQSSKKTTSLAQNQSIWKRLPDVPCYGMTLISLHNSLLAIGGYTLLDVVSVGNALRFFFNKKLSTSSSSSSSSSGFYTSSKAVYAFCCSTQKWIEVACIPTSPDRSPSRLEGVIALTASNEIIVLDRIMNTIIGQIAL